MLDDSQVLIGVAAMLSKKFGNPYWVKYARLFNIGAADKFNKCRVGHEFMNESTSISARPLLGIAILRSMSHTMLAIHFGSIIYYFDGKQIPNSQIENLVDMACQWFSELGLPIVKKKFKNVWLQIDAESCGFHVLDFVRYVLDSVEVFEGELISNTGPNCPTYALYTYKDPNSYRSAKCRETRWSDLSFQLNQLCIEESLHFPPKVPEQDSSLSVDVAKGFPSVLHVGSHNLV